MRQAEQPSCRRRSETCAPRTRPPARPTLYTPLMRAIRVEQFGGPEVLQVADVDDPRPGAGRGGRSPARGRRESGRGVHPLGAVRAAAELPYTPGGDGAGVVEALGEGVTGVTVGDRVYVAAFLGKTGTYAERIACRRAKRAPPARRSVVWPGRRAWGAGGDGVPGAGAAGAGQGGRDRAGPRRQRGRRHRGGAVGTRAGIARVRHGRQRRRRQRRREDAGAHAGVRPQPDGYATRITEAAGGTGGIDVVLEMLANVNLDRDLTLLAPKGRVVVIGNRGRIEIDPRLTMGKETAILGTTLWSTTPRGVHADSRRAGGGPRVRRASARRRTRTAARAGGRRTPRDPRGSGGGEDCVDDVGTGLIGSESHVHTAGAFMATA